MWLVRNVQGLAPPPIGLALGDSTVCLDVPNFFSLSNYPSMRQ
jgi:hypothetical protein